MPSLLKYETAVENVALPVIFVAYGVCAILFVAIL
jgi:hypothetical protein